MKLKTVLLMFLACVLLAACERSPQTSRAAGEDRDAYEDRVSARLKEFDHRFDGLDARLKGMDRADQDHLRVDIEELRARKAALKQKLNDLHKVSDQSWMDIRGRLDSDLDQLEIAYNIVAANNHGHDHPPLKFER